MAKIGPGYQAGAIDLSALKQQAESAPPASGVGFEALVTATEANIEDEVLRMSLKVPVIVHIGTDRSPDSAALQSAFADLARGQRQFRVAYVDADATPSVAQMFGVRVLPTVIAIAAGRPVTSFEGNQPAEQLTQWVEALVSNVGAQLEGLGDDTAEAEQGEPEDPRLDAATAALNRGDFDAATAVYDEILGDDPTNAEIKQARATVGVLKRLDPGNRTIDPVAAADADRGDVDKQLAAADAETVAGMPEKAFDRLLALVKAEPKAKERLLELFTLFEPGDPRVIEARTKLASALF
ncbi:tetratricopeptide repeat protein [Corynebacterium qintianiae]|uniref:Tetratricopeptide repeat protein n=1 Tax=Corynebacterium qintianiae TaxID=2709392 RepID=A0A7T0KPK1_9CORY|nr:tetratricopeptide repeat protein [Corynebacterium qintianiae]QPK84025.1 tetratricopeptide repeat protein [Corynebacterium qintianiae]